MILSIGEALIDFIYSEKEGIPVFRPVPGGSPMNTAIAMSRLEVPVSFLCKISSDMFGEMIMKHISSNAVNTSTIIRDKAPTTLGFAKITQGIANYAFYTNGSADRSITTEELLDSANTLADKITCMQVGSISLALTPGADAITEFVLSRPTDCVLSFDPNIRADLIEDRESFIKRMLRLFSSANIVKISDEDLSWIFPDVESLKEGAEKILNLGAQACIITNGKHGSFWYSKLVQVQEPIYDIPVVDTIGAGDTFHGGLLAYLHHNNLLKPEALETISAGQAKAALVYATKAAAITCSRQGANPPTRKELLAL